MTPTVRTIPELIARGDVGYDRYVNVLVKKRNGNEITFKHDAGMATVPLARFDFKNLDRIFPGLIARVEAIKAARQRAGDVAMRKAAEDEHSLKTNLEHAVSEVLNVSDGKSKKEPFVCILVSSRDTYVVGEGVPLVVRIVNSSSDDACLITAADPGDARFPISVFEVTDSDGRSFLEKGEASDVPLFSGLLPRDFSAVPSGGAFNPLRHDAATFLHYSRPGTYKVRFVYSTRSDRLDDYFGGVHAKTYFRENFAVFAPLVYRLFSLVKHVDLKSNEMKITLRESEK